MVYAIWQGAGKKYKLCGMFRQSAEKIVNFV